MSESQLTPDESLAAQPLGALEKFYIEAYLRSKGHTWCSLRGLPEEEGKRLMTEASTYASTRLAEVETRQRLEHDLHGTSQG